MRDSCGSRGTGETPQAFSPRPAESEHLEGKSTTPLYLVNSNKCRPALQVYPNLLQKQEKEKLYHIL